MVWLPFTQEKMLGPIPALVRTSSYWIGLHSTNVATVSQRQKVDIGHADVGGTKRASVQTRLVGSILLLMPRSCAKRVNPSRLSRILLLLMFHVQLSPASCAREGATELNRSVGWPGEVGIDRDAPLWKLSPKM